MPESENLENRFEQRDLELHRQFVQFQNRINSGVEHPRDISSDLDHVINIDRGGKSKRKRYGPS
jgi:hypothetical protein